VCQEEDATVHDDAWHIDWTESVAASFHGPYQRPCLVTPQSHRDNGNASITSSCSANGTSDVWPPARIRPSTTTAPIGAKCKRQRAGASLRFRRSADFITAISAPPECAIQRLHARWSKRPSCFIRRASVFLTQRLSSGPPRRSRPAYTLTHGQARLPRSANQVCDRDTPSFLGPGAVPGAI
jgi:hypothetical protein